MNKIYKIVKNKNGVATVCSELTKSNSKGNKKALSIIIAMTFLTPLSINNAFAITSTNNVITESVNLDQISDSSSEIVNSEVTQFDPEKENGYNHVFEKSKISNTLFFGFKQDLEDNRKPSLLISDSILEKNQILQSNSIKTINTKINHSLINQSKNISIIGANHSETVGNPLYSDAKNIEINKSSDVKVSLSGVGSRRKASVQDINVLNSNEIKLFSSKEQLTQSNNKIEELNNQNNDNVPRINPIAENIDISHSRKINIGVLNKNEIETEELTHGAGYNQFRNISQNYTNYSNTTQLESDNGGTKSPEISYSSYKSNNINIRSSENINIIGSPGEHIDIEHSRSIYAKSIDSNIMLKGEDNVKNNSMSSSFNRVEKVYLPGHHLNLNVLDRVSGLKTSIPVTEVGNSLDGNIIRSASDTILNGNYNSIDDVGIYLNMPKNNLSNNNIRKNVHRNNSNTITGMGNHLSSVISSNIEGDLNNITNSTNLTINGENNKIDSTHNGLVNGNNNWLYTNNYKDINNGTSIRGNNNINFGSSKVIGNNNIILGSNTEVSTSNSVILGSNSKATMRDNSVEEYTNIDISADNGIVSVGTIGKERQIINVAGATHDTDAVNLRQLKEALNNFSGNQGGVNIETFDGYHTETGSTGVASNVAFVPDMNDNIVLNSSNYHNSLYKPAVTFGLNDHVHVNEKITIGGHKFSNDNLTLTSDTIDNLATINDLNDQDNLKKAVNVETLKNALTQPINIDTSQFVKYDTPQKDLITLNEQNGSKITSLNDGLVTIDSKDAVNGSQLYGVLNGIKEVLGGNATIEEVGNKQTLTMSNIGNTGKDTVHDAIEYLNNKPSQNYSFKIATNQNDNEEVLNGETVRFINGKNINITNNGKDITISTNNNISADSFTTTGNNIFNDEGITIGDIKLKSNDINMGNNKVSGIADGDINETSTEAVNGKQIYELDRLNVKYDDLTKEKITLGGTQSRETTIDKVKDGLIESQSKEAVNGGQIFDLIEKGLSFKTDDNITTKYKLGSIVPIKGDNNITTSYKNGELLWKLNNNINVDSISINGTTVSMSNSGINAGGKRITNVDDAVDDYDAVNFKQLKAMQTTPPDLSNYVKYDDAGKTQVTFGATGENTINGNEVKLTNVAEGEISSTSTDAITGKQIYELDQLNVKYDDLTKEKITLGGNQSGETTIDKVKDGLISETSKEAVNGSQINKLANSISSSFGGKTTYDSTKNELKPILTVSNVEYNNIQDALTALDNKDHSSDWNIADTNGNQSIVSKGNTVKFNGDKNISVELDANEKQVNVSLKENISLTSVTTGNAVMNNDGVKVGDVKISSNGINVANNKVTGVADGDINATSTEAINGKQIYELDRLNVKYDDLTKEKVTLGTINKSTTVDNLKDGLVTIDSKEAINGSQIYGLLDGVKEVLGGNATITQVNNKSTLTMSNVGNTGKDTVHDAIEYLKNRQDGGGYIFNISANGGDSKQIGTDQTVNFNQGKNISITREGNNINISTTDDLTAKTITVGDKGININNDGIDLKNTNIENMKTVENIYDTANNGKGVNVETLRNNLVAKEDSSNNITIGAEGNGDLVKIQNKNGGDRRISGVQNAIYDNDAVNYGQLKALRNHVDQVDKDSRAGIAGAIAAASLPQSFREGGKMTSIAFGNYKGASAIAVGHSAISENGRHAFKFNANINTQKDVGVGMGYGYMW